LPLGINIFSIIQSPVSDPHNRDNWAKTVSPNPNVKVFIGAPASSSAAGSGYVSASTLATIIQQTGSEYSSFGGVMLWDMSQAYGSCFLATDLNPEREPTDWYASQQQI
jgi:hypothetical protein